MVKCFLIGLMMGLSAALSGAAPMRVSALQPLLADLARQVGGERVRVYDVVGEGGNLHRFEPRPADLETLQASALVLAAGKNLESYLGRIKDSLKDVTVLEVGRTIPSLSVGTAGGGGCCPEHAEGAVWGEGEGRRVGPPSWFGHASCYGRDDDSEGSAWRAWGPWR